MGQDMRKIFDKIGKISTEIKFRKCDMQINTDKTFYSSF